MESISQQTSGLDGGAEIIITGHGFSNTDNSVKIDSSNCQISSSSDTEIRCETTASASISDVSTSREGTHGAKL